MTTSGAGGPRHVAVVGAGMVGLATAWFLQQQGMSVTVLDREGPGAGASWGNAGLLTPALATPLPSPQLLRAGLRALGRPASPVSVTPAAEADLVRFLAGFVRHSTARRWRRALEVYATINPRALAAFDELVAGGVDAPVHAAPPLLACFTDREAAGRLATELEEVAAVGLPADHELLSGRRARALEPALHPGVVAAVRVHGQRYLDPPRFVAALAAAVRARGGELREHAPVSRIEDDGRRVRVVTAHGRPVVADAVVVAAGAWLGPLVRPYGVRQVVQPGRGYSCSLAADPLPSGPLYFTERRVTATPLGERLRVTGMMELRRAGAPPDPRRHAAIAAAVGELLPGADVGERRDEWVGPRPLTADGLPLIGPTRSPRVLVAGGHGMWGVTLGPLTGRLVAQTLVAGRIPDVLAPFDPLR